MEATTKKWVNRKPAGMREGHNEELACRHRNTTVCLECVNTYENIVEVFGAFYWVATKEELKEYNEMMAN